MMYTSYLGCATLLNYITQRVQQRQTGTGPDLRIMALRQQIQRYKNKNLAVHLVMSCQLECTCEVCCVVRYFGQLSAVKYRFYSIGLPHI